MPVEIHQTFPEDIDNILVFNNTKPIVVDYRDRQHYYLFCTENLDIDAGQYGTLHLQASVWNEVPVEQGTKLLPVGINPSSPQLFTVITRATNKTYSAIPPLQFDISNITVTKAGNIIGPIGIPYYKLMAMEISNGSNGIVSVQQSISGTLTSFTNTMFVNMNDTTKTEILSAAANGLFRVPLVGRYVQVSNNLTTGSITASFIFFMNSVDL